MTGANRVTIEDIARRVGVSTASASRALNGRPGVSAATRERILQVAAEVGFTGNSTARALSLGRSGRIAITLPELETEYFARILAGAAEAFQERGLSLAIATTGHSHERQIRRLKELVHEGVDGALLILPAESEADLRNLHDTRLPFVVVDSPEPLGSPLVCVSAAHAEGARQAIGHLAELGHSRIGMLTGERGLLSTEERMHGAKQALAAAGLELDPRKVIEATYTGLSDEGSIRELITGESAPTAVFAFNDRLAFGVLRVAHQVGIRVPQQLSVIGFDDLEATAWVTPTLTTIRQPLARMGATAADLLIQWIEGRRPGAMFVGLPTELVVRESTASPIQA